MAKAEKVGRDRGAEEERERQEPLAEPGITSLPCTQGTKGE